MDSAILFLLVSLLGVSHAYPGGPPVSTNPGICQDMTPQHYASVQDMSTNPFMIKVSSKCYQSGASIEVEITSENMTPFKGFFVQARSDMSGSASHGMFTSMDIEQQQLSCFGGNNNALGHSGKTEKTSSRFTWKAGPSDMADLKFVVTVVKQRDTYWVMIPSEQITYDPTCGGAAPPPSRPTVSQGTVYSSSVLLLVAAFVMARFA